ncbi:hypothetical protein HYPSUDRAFT_217069 [Hypholoma sublateritium FD-334 SS-4]|uniref:NACHT domain-containing protein n=1 Tax=Hypholoma sublateritium (strain FD-334 SS-4) TaxID=945553 RepID=A0A0D2NV05_HYPSF|nr:hypothetical protein HYPSUDRAFT_217069 [Hypholoma sublateritium FD-334 SS-4]
MERQHLPATNAMFHGERGTTINIHDGTFMQNNHPPPTVAAVHNCYNEKDGFTHLQAHVATSAFDSAQKVDAPKCHPNTREAVQDDIMNWILPTVMRIQWMLWLNGAAGAGKSAIARSIVALCLAQNIPIARFFFFRTDATRNTIEPVVATLVHQLIQQIPDLLPIITPKIQSDPLVFTKSLETQLRYLVFDPLRQLNSVSPLSVVVLLFDGVDECSGDDNQTNLIHLIADFLRSRELPIIAFFGSRAENQLKQIFQSYEVATNLQQLALDDHYLPDADIRLFLNDKFAQIKTTHPFKDHLDTNWPDPAHVQGIVDKSSGQFIYASVVINFLLSPRRNPGQQLEIIRGLRPTGNLTPFAQLDALYRHIFSRIEDIDRTSLILAWTIFSHWNLRPFIENCSIINDIPVLLADLSSVLVYEEDSIRFLHASLPDFLLDKTRSQGYFLDKRIWCTRISVYWFSKMSAGRPIVKLDIPSAFLQYAEGTAELRKHVLSFNCRQAGNPFALNDYLTALRKVDFGDDGELYRCQLNCTTRYIFDPETRTDSIHMSRFQKNHDISEILAQIESEKAAEARQRTEETRPASTAIDALDISRNGPATDADATSQHVKPRGRKRGASRDVDVEGTPRRSFRSRPQITPSTSSGEPTTAPGTSRQDQGRAKKRRR